MIVKPGIDLRDKFVCPGFVDPHTHIFLHSYDETPPANQKRDESFVERIIRSVNHCLIGLLAAYTTYRDLGSEGMQEADCNVRDSSTCSGAFSTPLAQWNGQSAPKFEEWFTNMTLRLEEWYKKSFEFAAEKKLEFRNIQDYYVRGKIHRPTPRLRQPSRASRLICIESVQALVEDYKRQRQQGRLFYPWHTGYILFEAGIYLLDTAWNCSPWLLEVVNCNEIIDCIREYPPMLRKVANFWPALETCTDTLEELSAPVLLRLETAVQGGMVTAGLEDDLTTARIVEHLFPIADIGVQPVSNHESTPFDFNDFDWGMGGQFEIMGNDDILSFCIGSESTLNTSNI
ncbi:hypothetical protein NKR23_g6871 [Pleurostoma richardsiae]|uniref:Amidohydrolase-related domain-containing protein n=1 Tax=Pleurostoma richardsiae TaxID=41990 RepID=A0AA38RXT3_9PEZI|nr:hypothetical protein NKR23_g6871 [Pleurostoma richardsiae]